MELFSEETMLIVCRKRSCMAAGDSAMTSAASFRANEACCSPSAATTLQYSTKFQLRWINLYVSECNKTYNEDHKQVSEIETSLVIFGKIKQCRNIESETK